MVYDLPKVLVSHIYGYVMSVPSQDQVFGAIIETHKGTPNTPVLVSSPQEMVQEFGISMDAYWGVGGQPIYLTRAVYQGTYDENTGQYSDPATKAVHYLYDTSATPKPVIKLVAKKRVHIRFIYQQDLMLKEETTLYLKKLIAQLNTL